MMSTILNLSYMIFKAVNFKHLKKIKLQLLEFCRPTIRRFPYFQKYAFGDRLLLMKTCKACEKCRVFTS